jgi:hypothetical protein
LQSLGLRLGSSGSRGGSVCLVAQNESRMSESGCEFWIIDRYPLDENGATHSAFRIGEIDVTQQSRQCVE